MLIFAASTVWAAPKGKKKAAAKSSAGIASKAANPYLGMIVVDARSGEVLFEQNSDRVGYPASVLKLMDLLIILEKLEKGELKLEDKVTVTAEASRIGGSRVYLKEHEEFTLEEMLYALMVQSANDVARALSIHIAGCKEGFVDIMNIKAKQLGMNSTVFHSDHGLPPGKGQQPDLTTARDLAVLCMELMKHTNAFKYTSTKFMKFRDGTFDMRAHNKLLWSFRGCDGLKTGYYKKAGFSIAATAERNGNRVLVVILGSEDRKVRDQKAAELMSKGLNKIGHTANATEASAAEIKLDTALATASQSGADDEDVDD